MSIKIKVRAFVERGTPKYEVLKIKGVLKRERLPHGYIDTAPSFYLTKNGSTIKLHDGSTLSVGGIYRVPTFERFIKEIEDAGNRLHRINKQIGEFRDEFEGVRTIQI